MRMSFPSREAKGGKFAYYVCGTLLKRGAGSCIAPYLNAEKFENLVIEKIKERILTEENLRICFPRGEWNSQTLRW